MFAERMDFVHMILNAGLMVQFVLVLLLFFSVACWTIILAKFRYMRKAYKESVLFTDFFWKSRDLTEAFNRAKQFAGSPVARVYRVGYVELKKLTSPRPGSLIPAAKGDDPPVSAPAPAFTGIANVKRALRRAINTEVTRMTQLTPFLATTGNAAPFIGLFGTVWGIMNSFHGIGLRGSASLAVVAPGISEALVATAAGLAAAIPAVIAFNYFTQKIRVIESELESFSADFLNIIEREILRAREDRA
jgi:biopolymer transport protein TolQ